MSDSEQMGRCRMEITAAYERTSFRPNDSDLLIADAIDRLAADVAAVKAKVDAVSPEDVRHFVESEKAWVALVTEQRDAAIRERDQWKEEARLAVVNRDEARAEVERLRAELDDREQTEQVERMREENEILHRASLNYIHDRDQYRRERDEALVEAQRLKVELYDREQEILSLRADTVERCEPPAGSQPAAQGISPKVADTQPTGNAAPAAGWLTEREQHALRHILAADVEPVIRSILARAGSPPVVEVPSMYWLTHTAGLEALSYRQAMDKAGVPWKEVPRE